MKATDPRVLLFLTGVATVVLGPLVVTGHLAGWATVALGASLIRYAHTLID